MPDHLTVVEQVETSKVSRREFDVRESEFSGDQLSIAKELLEKQNLSLTIFGLPDADKGQKLSLQELGEKYNIIILASGLISNADQWDNSKHSLVEKLLKNEKSKHPDAETTIAIAVCCPGFGGSALKVPQAASTEDVGTQRYVQVLELLHQTLHPSLVSLSGMVETPRL